VVASIAVASNGASFAPSQPTVTYLGIDVTDPALAVLRLTNGTASPLFYYGYDPARPHYDTSRLGRRGWRRDERWWCADGSSRQQLAAGQSVDFRVRLDAGEGKPFRVGVEIYRDATSDRSEWVWGPPIDPQEHRLPN
jgi:hypothetical protein